ncbi:hypothetical protein HBI31_166350 [Parastagonospora nodorum]|nr:hypothetical protein HBH51_157740 [Parastagonospora nodorum]KAH4791045.1 hypothetical protein HBH62_030030 [Parastagonospora nodorum]KAH4797819.1 hypothetical protein HBH63_070020 [Parastagonospora nodorum]KAH4980571.1 hypothetical protein HBI76_181580 [Parastagonospora nodorum]KAH5197333.1 hypothetical protein HBH77_136260 [Parastagonospora nodorum]
MTPLIMFRTFHTRDSLAPSPASCVAGARLVANHPNANARPRLVCTKVAARRIPIIIFTHTTSPNNSTLPPPQTAIMKRNVVIFLIILILFILIAAIAYLIYYLQTRMAVGGTASSVSDMTEP